MVATMLIPLRGELGSPVAVAHDDQRRDEQHDGDRRDGDLDERLPLDIHTSGSAVPRKSPSKPPFVRFRGLRP
ncbi:hypothetical protein [Halosegnis marinus]|uniref:hypothetical protein n=1 Tax=Halosegnis marinus TaxID=3034023 RepID=UPI00361BB3BC